MFNEMDLRGLLIKGKLRDAVNYLEQFKEQRELFERYHRVFAGGEYQSRCANPTIDALIRLYHEYYRQVFYFGLKHEECAKQLAKAIREYAKVKIASNLASQSAFEQLDSAEHQAAHIVKDAGYQFLGGTTSGWYGPYIWHTNEEQLYNVTLPFETVPVKVVMMRDFVSNSWLDYISFGTISTGGWAGNDGALYCVHSAYADRIETPNFQISFLKHEGQHNLDKTKYKLSDPVLLEYRAKLVELIYYPDVSVLVSFIAEADDSNPKNSHSMSSHMIVTELSRRIFGADKPSLSIPDWQSKHGDVCKIALELLYASTPKAN